MLFPGPGPGPGFSVLQEPPKWGRREGQETLAGNQTRRATGASGDLQEGKELAQMAVASVKEVG